MISLNKMIKAFGKMSILIGLAFLVNYCSSPKEKKVLHTINADSLNNIPLVIKSSVLDELSQAFGFKVGQNYSLGKISDKYPALIQRIEIAKLKFDKTFSGSFNVIDSILNKEGLNTTKIKNELISKLKSTTDFKNLSFEEASKYISLVENRSQGEIQKPILGALLSFHPRYIKSPVDEFIDGFVYRFESKDNPKAKDLDFHIDIPKSWLSKEAHRPNIVQNFISQNGYGTVVALVIVKTMPDDIELSENNVKEIASEDAIKDNLPPNSTLYNGGFIRIDGLPGIFQKYRIYQTQLDEEIVMYCSAYNIYYKKYMISVQCSSLGKKADERKTASIFIKYDQLFRLIANSLVIQQQWK